MVLHKREKQNAGTHQHTLGKRPRRTQQHHRRRRRPLRGSLHGARHYRRYLEVETTATRPRFGGAYLCHHTTVHPVRMVPILRRSPQTIMQRTTRMTGKHLSVKRTIRIFIGRLVQPLAATAAFQFLHRQPSQRLTPIRIRPPIRPTKKMRPCYSELSVAEIEFCRIPRRMAVAARVGRKSKLPQQAASHPARNISY